MTKINPSLYINFPVHQTIDIIDHSVIHSAVINMVQAYSNLNEQGNFSYRLLLPRGEELLTAKAKKIGVALQAEFLLALKKNKLKVNLKEIRYIHDENHYGWLLFNPTVQERFFAKNNVVDYY
jgi:hypothetical protein